MELLYIPGLVAIVPIVIACLVKSKVAKGILSGLSFLGYAALWFFSTAVTLVWGSIGANAIWLPAVLCIAVFAISMLLVWKPFKAKIRTVIILSVTAGVITLTSVFIIPVIYDRSIPVSTEEVFLPEYTPFGQYWYVDGVLTHHESLAAKLNEPSKLSLTGELPRLDGATALYPLYAAFVQATYPAPEPNLDIPEYFPYGDLSDDSYPSLAVCSRTATAYLNLIEGNADIVFLMGVSDVQREGAAERGYEIILTPVGREAFVFFVNNRNVVTNISTSDIKSIYSGEITNWRDVGGRNNEIRAYQRPDSSGSQVMLREIMGDIPIMPVGSDMEVFDTMMLMYRHVASYKNYRNSLGYSFLYYIKDMINENEVKFLSIDGIAPTEDNIASGAYPFANDFYAVTIKHNGEYLNPERTENIDMLLEWIQSPQGQYLVEATGYVPVN